MADVEKERVNLMVHPETKAEWDSAVDESTEYSSLSDLIRQSVAHELSDSPDAATAPNGREREQPEQTEAQTEILEQLTDTLANVENTVSELDDRLANVEQEVTATGQTDLKNKIFDSLPKADSDDGPDGKSAEDIAEEIRADRDRVSATLTKLEEQTGVVEAVGNINGQQFFAREDDQ
jgi:DNA-binding transcriptional regulator GbsR (MarR family)